MLVATIPMPAARSALQRTLVRHWYESPGTVFGSTWPQGCQPEPGLLAVLKSLPHRRVAAPTTGKIARRPFGRPSPASPRLHSEQQKQDQIATAWLHASELLVLDMMRRFRAASLARKIDRRKFADEAADVPVRLQPGAEIVAAFAVDLPGAVLTAANLPVEPLRVHYFRADEKAKISAVVARCKQQMGKCEERGMPDGVWIDGYRAAAESSARFPST